MSVLSLGEIFRSKKKYESGNSLSNLLQTPTEISGGSASSLHSNSSLRQFNLMELVKATNGFDRGMIIGEGGFGKVYKGKLDDQTLVAIKRAGIESAQGYAEFVAELILLSRVRHKNLVSLIGYSNENDEMIIVYEYMSRGTLRSHLYGTSLPPLPWKKRLEVLLDAARGLSYLHSLRPNGIIHRDVKSTNILLDSNYVAKMSDFGLSKFGPSVDQTHVSTAVKGSFGYLDPEYFKRQKLTDKSDIYSFGIVMLEVLCARVPINPQLEHEEANLAEWAAHHINNGKLQSIIDKRMKGSWNLPSVESFCQLLSSCLLEKGSERPNMTSVIFLLQNCIRLLESPSKSESPAL